MAAVIIDGKAIAAALRARIAAQVPSFRDRAGRAPGLATILVGEDPASQVYVRSKHRATHEAGMEGFEHLLADDVAQDELLSLIDRLNRDRAVDGILVQLPLPRGLDEQAVIAAIDPDKDVDGFHVSNAGRLSVGAAGMVPCTPLGCLALLKGQLGDLAGLHAVVVGRSNIVGKPVAQLLLRESCTVTIAHSRTRDLRAVVEQADILVAAVGRPEMIPGDWLKSGACVIDVGVNRIAAGDGRTRLVGDVHFESATAVAAAITPVPGGVGPMTIAMLLRNTLIAAHLREGLTVPEGL